MLFNYHFFIYYSIFYLCVVNYNLFIGSLITQHFDLIILKIFNFHEIDFRFNIQSVLINPSDYDFSLVIPTKTIINDYQIVYNTTSIETPSQKYDKLYTYFICIVSLINCVQILFMIYIFLINIGKTIYRRKLFLSFFYSNLILKLACIFYFISDQPLTNYCISSSKYITLGDNDCLYDYGFFCLIFITVLHSIICLMLLTKKYCSNITIKRRINSVNGNIVSEDISIIYQQPLLINTRNDETGVELSPTNNNYEPIQQNGFSIN